MILLVFPSSSNDDVTTAQVPTGTCLNGGTVLSDTEDSDEDGNFEECACAPGYTGESCESSEFKTHSIPFSILRTH